MAHRKFGKLPLRVFYAGRRYLVVALSDLRVTLACIDDPEISETMGTDLLLVLCATGRITIDTDGGPL